MSPTGAELGQGRGRPSAGSGPEQAEGADGPEEGAGETAGCGECISHCQCRPHGQRDADGQDGAVEIVNVSLVVKKMLMLMDQMKELDKQLAVVSMQQSLSVSPSWSK